VLVTTKVEGAPRERGLWLQWVLATTAGFLVGGFAAGAAARAMIDARGGDVIGLTPWEGAAVGAVAGLAIGIGQWLVVRRRMAHAGWWVLVTIVGWVVCDAVLAASGRINPTLGIGGAALSAIVIAVLQWLVLRRGATQAGRWIVVSAGALAVASFAGFAVILAAQFGSWFHLQPTDFPSAIPWGLAGMVMGPIYGAMTGAVLVWLVRPAPPAASEAAAAQGVRPLEGALRGTDPWNERLIAGGLLLLGFLLVFPAVIINAPGMGATSAVGRMLPFLFDPVWQKYWSVAFAVVTLYGLVILEGILRRAGDHICARLGMVSFTLATVMLLVFMLLDMNYLPGGRDFESFFIMFAFPAVIAYGLAILRTRILARWIGIVVVLWSTVTLIWVFPHNRGPFFYESALLLIAVALLVSQSPREGQRAVNDSPAS
jgi:hypothetical protein